MSMRIEFSKFPKARAYVLKLFGLPDTIDDEALDDEFVSRIGTFDMAEVKEHMRRDNWESAREEIRREVEAEYGITPNTNKSFQGRKIMSGTTSKEIQKKTSDTIRVKPASEQYLNTKAIGQHAKLGIAMRDEFGREAFESGSQLEWAKTGALLKHLVRKAGLTSVALDEHEEGLLNDLAEDAWCGKVGNEWHKSVSNVHVKALLRDVTSGGIEVSPEFFDSNIISFPLLNGELYPMVDVQEVPRGAAVESASVGNPTMIWGPAEGTASSLFDTDSLIAEINTSIHIVQATVEVGRDFLTDAAVNVGKVLEANIGARLMQELDGVIAKGNGTTQPEGIFTASGISTVSTVGGGSQAVKDWEDLYFGIGKQYRTKDCAFLSNDTNYARARQIANDPTTPNTTDQRRVFGMDYGSYTTLGHRHLIENIQTGNTLAAFGNFKKYRLYKRLGMEMQWVTQDSECIRRNIAILHIRARFGGKVVDPNAFAKIVSFPA